MPYENLSPAAMLVKQGQQGVSRAIWPMVGRLKTVLGALGQMGGVH
jgi:hypothetical protein